MNKSDSMDPINGQKADDGKTRSGTAAATTTAKNVNRTKSPEAPADKALNTMHQKDKRIKELKKELKTMEGEMTDKVSDLEEQIKQNHELKKKLKFAETKLEELDKKYDEAVTKLEHSSDEKENVEDSLKEKLEAVSQLQSRIETMTREQDLREQLHQRRYLELYQKGQEAVLIEQEEELVRQFAMEKGDPMTQKLVAKLLRTEKKLEKLKTSKREETYRTAPIVASNDLAKIGMLKSAIFYYLTGREKSGNLEMMMTLLEFTESQKQKIFDTLKAKKGK